ncbi:MAG: hypothetical protein IKY33_04430 [Clostridia bacterium]|nr:hypothetical protein [Clostridia bacterium]
MIKVNIVFDDIFDDTDIIAIPDEIFSHIEEIGQAFLHWVPTVEDPDYWTTIDGKKCVVAETDGFIKWLNATYCKDSEKAFVVARNTNYEPNLKIIEF